MKWRKKLILTIMLTLLISSFNNRELSNQEMPFDEDYDIEEFIEHFHEEYKKETFENALNDLYLFKDYLIEIKENLDLPTTLESPSRNLRDIEELRGKPLILLTFDDGPIPGTTSRFLDELEQRNARVTFFVLGTNAALHPDIMIRAFNNGHTIASHAYEHKELTRLTDEEIRFQINKANEILYEHLGIHNNLLRPPYGSVNDRVMEIASSSIALWNVDPLDWADRDANIIYNRIVSSASHGAIVVLHDIHPTTIDASIRAIDTLLEMGFAVISWEEAISLGYINSEENEKVFSLSLTKNE